MISLAASTVAAQSIVVDGSNSPYVISSPTAVTQVQVTSGGVLVVNAKLTVTGDMTVLGGGRVTVDDTVIRLQLAVTGTLTVDFGGSVDADGKGLHGGGSAGFGRSGATLDPSTFVVVAGPIFNPGGSHATLGEPGGYGQFPAAPVYGNPLMLNPGGGGGENGGGSGGGICDLAAGSLVLNGEIRANGISGVGAGSGAGGSVGIVATTISGGGSILANGGLAAAAGGAGRIKASFTTWSFSGTTKAFGAGASGSVSLVDSMNRLHVVTPVELTGGESFAAVLFESGGALTLSGDSTVVQPIAVPAGVKITFNHPRAADHLSLSTVDGTMTVKEPIALSRKLVLGGTLVLDKTLSVPDLDITATGVVTHSGFVRTFNLAVAGSLHLFSGGLIDATGLGLQAGLNGRMFDKYGATIDPTSSAIVAGSGPGNGGTHAGLGGQAVTANQVAAVYDNPELPVYPGGGGGGWSNNINVAGGNGGGILRISAASTIVDGRISADGQAAFTGQYVTDPVGGGAGGTVVLSTGPLSGAGQITARGGLGTIGGSGGGGGIVRIDASSIASSVTRSAAGGGGAAPGTVGAVVEHLSAALKIVSLPSKGVKTGTPFSYQATVVGATAAVTWSLPTAPAGAAVSATGLVTWAASGTVPVAFSLSASDGPATDLQTFALEVLTSPSITSTATLSAVLNAPYAYDADSTVQATGSGPITWSVLAGPPGLTIDAQTGAVAWVPASVGAFSVCLKATNAVGEALQCFAVQVTAAGSMMASPDAGAAVSGAPRFRSTPSTTAFCGVPYHYSGTRLPEADGAAPLTYSIEPLVGGALPAELSIDAMTGELTWTPQKANAGATSVRLVVTNALGRDEQVFSIAVECPGVTPKAVGCSCDAVGANELIIALALALVGRRAGRPRDA